MAQPRPVWTWESICVTVANYIILIYISASEMKIRIAVSRQDIAASGYIEAAAFHSRALLIRATCVKYRALCSHPFWELLPVFRDVARVDLYGNNTLQRRPSSRPPGEGQHARVPSPACSRALTSVPALTCLGY